MPWNETKSPKAKKALELFTKMCSLQGEHARQIVLKSSRGYEFIRDAEDGEMRSMRFRTLAEAIDAFNEGIATLQAIEAKEREYEANWFLSVGEIAGRTSFNRSFVKAEILRGNLPARKIGNQYAVNILDYEAWMKNPRRGSRSK